MWYVQLYFECAKLTSSIADPRFLFGRLPAHHIVKRGFAFYYSGDRYCLFRSPRLWRGINGIFIYAIVQQMWPSMWILIAMEVILIIVTAGAGMLDVLLEEASINLGLLMRS